MPGPTFPDFEDFLPRYHPREMLEMGISAAGIFHNRHAAAGLPREWFYDVAGRCHFGARPLGVWPYSGEAARTSAAHAADPGGWFQWYCRFCAGRRIPIDGFQISMWKKVGRWAVHRSPVWRSSPGLIDASALRQTLLEWSHDPDIALAEMSSADTSG